MPDQGKLDAFLAHLRGQEVSPLHPTQSILAMGQSGVDAMMPQKKKRHRRPPVPRPDPTPEPTLEERLMGKAIRGYAMPGPGITPFAEAVPQAMREGIEGGGAPLVGFDRNRLDDDEAALLDQWMTQRYAEENPQPTAAARPARDPAMLEALRRR